MAELANTSEKMLSLEQIRASLQERLALGLSWQADAAGLETRASGRKVWNLSWKPRKGNSEARLWGSVLMPSAASSWTCTGAAPKPRISDKLPAAKRKRP